MCSSSSKEIAELSPLQARTKRRATLAAAYQSTLMDVGNLVVQVANLVSEWNSKGDLEKISAIIKVACRRPVGCSRSSSLPLPRPPNSQSWRFLNFLQFSLFDFGIDLFHDDRPPPPVRMVVMVRTESQAEVVTLLGKNLDQSAGKVGSQERKRYRCQNSKCLQAT